MPSLRLSAGEAVDVVAYLSSQKIENWQEKARPARDVAKQRKLLVDAMGTAMRRSELDNLLGELDDGQREVLLGEKTIAKYGCAGCHDIKGTEQLGPIGSELSYWRDKFVAQLDFALIPYHGENKET